MSSQAHRECDSRAPRVFGLRPERRAPVLAPVVLVLVLPVWLMATTEPSMGQVAAPAPRNPQVSSADADADANGSRNRLLAPAKEIAASALPLLQSSADQWIQRKTCTSCHHQTLGLMAIGAAREAGFGVNEGLAAKQRAHIRRSIGRSNADFPQGVGPSTFGAAFGAWGMHLGGEADRVTPVRTLGWLMSIQQANGQLPSLSHRPPMEHRSATGTALLIHAVRRWGGHLSTADTTRARAATWLDGHEPKDTESAAWRLLGLYWQGRGGTDLRNAARPVLDAQQPDGAWRQHALRPTDVYATGLALTVLLQTGQLDIEDARATAAVAWLIDQFDQEARAWRVATRRRVMGLPYFETGYPFGEDQFISYGASAWATTALSLFLKGGPGETLEPPSPAEDVTSTSPCGNSPPLLCSARWGTAEDFDGQMTDASSEAIEDLGEQGLHLLMAAAGDPAKLAKVLGRWPGSVDGASELGRAALHLAVLAPNIVDAGSAVDLLLARGADPNVADQKGLTPLHLAARRADVGLVDRLLRAGAKTTAIAAGIDGMSPLGAAVSAGATDVVARLLEAGADPAIAMTGYGSNALQEAVYSDQPDIAEMLVADPKRAGKLLALADVDGWTAAHYLFLQPFGDRRMAEIVLGAGADLEARDNEGRSVRDLATKEGLQVLLGGDHSPDP